MFHPVSIDIVRFDDFSVFNSMKALATELKLKANTVVIIYIARTKPARDQGQYQPVRSDINDPFNSSNAESLFGKDCFDMQDVSFNFQDDIRITITRPLDSGHNKLAYGRDTLRIEIENNKNELNQLSAVMSTCRKHFRTVDTEFLPKLLSDDLTNYYMARETSLARLESKISEVATYFTGFRLEQEKQLVASAKALDDKHTARMEELEAQFKTRHDKLDERDKELEERKKTLDDRASKHARRETYKDIKKIIKDRTTKFELTSETINKRQSVQQATLLGLLVVAGLFGYCFYVNVSKTEINWVAIGSQVALGVALATLLTFYIRWQNQWFKEHANEELRLQKLDLDIDRATWLVELAMEWQNETEKEMPSEMLNKLSQSLFTDAERNTEMHPLESLISGLIDKKGELIVKPSELQVKRGGEK